MPKMMKRTNGTGSITKVKERRRKPYKACVTTGWEDNGKQIRKVLGYFKTMDEATIALANYKENPYDISGGRATFNDIYDKWSEQKFPHISESNIKGYEASYKHCTFLYKKAFKDIGVDDLQYVVDMGLASDEDLDLFQPAETPKDAWKKIKVFHGEA